MKTLFLTQDFPPDTGGMARMYGELCSRFPTDGVEVVTVRQSYGGGPLELPQGLRIVRMPWPQPAAKTLLNVMRWTAWLAPRLRDGSITALQAGNIRPTGYIASWAGARHHVPYVIYVHGKDLMKERRRANASARVRWTARRILGRASAIIANSDFTADLTRALLRELSCPGDARVHVVNPGTDPVRFRYDAAGAARWRDTVGTRGPVLLSTARLVPRKGIDTVLEGLADVVRGFPDVVYLIAGSGPDRARLDRMVRELDLTAHVRFLGTIAEADLPGLYSAADLFVLPVREEPDDDEVEGFGIVYCEAAACGVAVVAGASGGTSDALRDGETGVLVPPSNPAALSEAIVGLLSDPARRKKMGERGRAAVEEYYNWDRAAAQAWAIIESIAASAPLV